MYNNKLVITLFKETHPSFLENKERLEGVNNPYSVTLREIAEEIRRRKLKHIVKYRPIVFKEGRPTSYLLELCSPEAAAEEESNDSVTLTSNLVHSKMVYLDDGFEYINPDAKIVKKLSDQIALYRQMIRQVRGKRAYLHEELRKYKREIEKLPKDSKERGKLLKRVGYIADKINATYVYDDPSTDLCYFPLENLSKNYHDAIPAENALELESILKYNHAVGISMSPKYQTGREDFWLDKFEKGVQGLPPGSYVDIFVGAAHVDGLRVKGYDVKWKDLQRNEELNKVMGNFKEKLEEKFGKIQVIDLTEETVKREIEQEILAKGNSSGRNP